MQISISSVQRILKSPPAPTTNQTHTTESSPNQSNHDKQNIRIKSRGPNHTWLIDLSVVPTSEGFHAPWFPFALPQSWPFCHWVVAIIDHFSRQIVAYAVFKSQPLYQQIRDFIARAIRNAHTAPKYIISDKGTQFWSDILHKAGKKSHYEKWCKRRGIAPRFGAIGKYGSIAIIERFFRSMKSECTRRIIMPMRTEDFRHELGIYFDWYNQTRPHQGLNGKCPAEIYSGIARHAPEYDPRKTALTLAVSYHHGRKYLPVIALKPAA